MSLGHMCLSLVLVWGRRVCSWLQSILGHIIPITQNPSVHVYYMYVVASTIAKLHCGSCKCVCFSGLFLRESCGVASLWLQGAQLFLSWSNIYTIYICVCAYVGSLGTSLMYHMAMYVCVCTGCCMHAWELERDKSECVCAWLHRGAVCVCTLIRFGSGLQSKYTNLRPSLKDLKLTHIFIHTHKVWRLGLALTHCTVLCMCNHPPIFTLLTKNIPYCYDLTLKSTYCILMFRFSCVPPHKLTSVMCIILL